MAAGTITREQQVIDAARANCAAMTQLELERLQWAVEWVRLHPGAEVDTTVEWGMRELEIAGDGAPTLDEGAVAEFALAIGVSTDSGRLFLGDAVELCYRLPRIWARVVDGRVPVWKARRIAAGTRSLPLDGAAYVDRALYFVARRCSFAEIDRQVDRARKAFDPVEAERRRVEAMEQRHFEVDLHQVSYDGLVHVEGDLDIADALALEEYVAAKAAQLDPELPLDVRRARALGMLGEPGDGTRVRREVTIYAHARPGDPMVEVENTRTVITPEQLREWCQTAGTKVTVRPVLDLDEILATDAHEPTELLKEQVRLRYRECVFPDCHRPSRSCDLDHIIPWPFGPTATSNLAPLCRGHHRLKTHTRWRYEYVPGAGFVWTDPHGRRHTS